MLRAATAVVLALSCLPACDCSEPLQARPEPEQPSRPIDDDDDGFGAVEGVLCNAHIGDVVKDATVRIVFDDGSFIEDVTDDDGHFFLDDAPAG